MEPQNQFRFQEYQQTIGQLQQMKAQLVQDIATMQEQLKNMQLELDNIDLHIIYNQGGLAALELYTKENIALVAWPADQPLALNPYQATQQVAQQAGIAQPQSQAAPQPVQPQVAPVPPQPQPQVYSPQPAITPQAQTAFAPKPVPDFSTEGAIQGPQIVQGTPPTQTE